MFMIYKVISDMLTLTLAFKKEFIQTLIFSFLSMLKDNIFKYFLELL